jgi:hypothetical protein
VRQLQLRQFLTRAIPGLAGAALAGILPALACGVLLFARLGARGAVALLLAGCVLALPGFALLGRPRCTVAVWLTALTGIALSSAGIVVAGSLGFSFLPRTWLLTSLLVSAMAIAWRRYLITPQQDSAISDGGFAHHPRDTVALLCVVGLGLALSAPALLAVGVSIDGAQRFGAFFCADLFKHAAYTGALASGPLPPVDPFSAGDPLRYYWLSYVLPAAALQVAGSPVRAIDLLLGQTLLQTFALSTLLFGLARRLGAGPAAAAAATLLGFASLNLDGLAALFDAPYADMRELVQIQNLESLDLTLLFGAPDRFAASTLYRLCLYVPQHQLAILLLLVWAHLSLRPDAHVVRVRAARMAVVAVLPLVSLLVAPAAFAVIALTRLAMFFTDRSAPAQRMRAELIVEAIAFAAALLLIRAGEMLGAAGDTRAAFDLVQSDRGPTARLFWFLPQLFTSFGGLLLFCCVGAWRSLANPSRSGMVSVLPLALLGGGFGCLFVSELLLPRSDLRINVELKASFVAWIAMVISSALAFQELHRSSGAVKTTFVAAALVLGLGLPSIAADVLWHSQWPWDGALRKRWHVAVPRADMTALDWAREHLPAGARFVQRPSPSFLEGGVDAWVPIFAGRPVVIATRATVLRAPRLEQARRLFRSTDVGEASRLARELGSEYVYLSFALDPDHYARMLLVLGADARLFRLVYSAGQASIWRVM